MVARSEFLTRAVMRPYVDGPAFVLTMWDVNKRAPHGQHQCGYMLVHKGYGVVFKGSDYGCAPMDCIDSERCVRGLLGFLTLKPGDTDPDYFADYTPAQLDFANQYGEVLSMYCDEENPYPFDEFEVL